MPFVRGLEINGFRGIKHSEGSIPLKKFNVIVGRNNSGKSSFLRALLLFPDPILQASSYSDLFLTHGSVWEGMVYRYRGKCVLKYATDLGELTFTLEYFGANTTAGAKAEFSFGGVERQEINLSPPQQTVFLKPLTYSTYEDRKYLKRLFKEMDPQQAALSHTLYVAEPSESLLLNSWPELELRNFHVKIAREVSKCVSDSFTELSIRMNEVVLRKMSDGVPFYVRFSDQGKGVQFLVYSMALIKLNSPTLVLWDDFGSYMNPMLVKQILEYLAKSNFQVVLTTHSIDVILELVEVEPEDSQLLQFEKDGRDVLHHRTLCLDEIKDLLDSNQDPRKLATAVGI
ncbi:hypothetical protein B9Q11_04940 [Candidatus Marsarchaeota G2 archaeon ECH_B_SAG-F08]|uniref:Uncharacterized protein n=1 Tax=Candidatus Marsarchaeota G2 archaeon ECH_B_SAG-F08 TaxID=1978165 RepID=A0A2R6BEK0_9ARCH|nr:MAG: hypothetical protein B9Q11_04940 [Candidatus Marsarchaeota G2 archaeon ECH_B_SAG-F08]